MRSSGSMGAATSWWTALLLLATFLSTASTVYAKDEPTIVVKEFKSPPNNPKYFPSSNVVLFQEYNSPRTIWRSTDGGAKWDKAEGIDHDKSFALVMHQFDPDRAYALTLGNVHWKTNDKGKTWEKFYTGAYTSDFADTIGKWMVFHADDPDKILFTGMQCEGFFCEELTMYTTDGFENKAKLLRTQTQGCRWAKSSSIFTTGEVDLDATRIMCVVRSGMFSPRDENRLYVSDNYFKPLDGDVLDETEVNLNGNRPVQGVVDIAEVKKYLLAATSSPNTAEMALFVTDDTKVWHRAIFPQDHPIIETAYTVLESTNYSIQIDVRTGKRISAPMGTLLTSNSNGTYFTRNIEHTNRNQYASVDFEKVTGIQGIFLVNRVDNWKEVEKEETEKKIKTEITFDDGRTFEAIKAGDDNIHLHSVTEPDNVGTVFSSPAPGLVMGNGNHGKFLEDYWEASLYISDDAGKTWTEGPKGPHKYEFGDQGSILVAVEDSKEANIQEIKYSLNHGIKWETTKLPDDLSILPWSLTTTQDSTSLKFILTARKGPKDSPSFCVISIDFEGLHEATCKKTDMEYWYARKDSDGNPSCVMGHRQKFSRRKKDAKCFIKKEFKGPTPETSRCDCTNADFECDFNFIPDGDECKLEGPVLAPKKACETDDPEEKFMGSSGWRLIPGNQCKHVKGDQKDKEKEWKCSDTKSRPSNSSGEISVTSKTFKGGFDLFEKHYLERGELSSYDDETIIARPEKISDGAGDIFITHNHGKTWATPKELEGKDIYAIITHTYVKDMVFFLTTKKKVYYTTDRGKSIDSFTAPEPLDRQAGVSPLSFHPDQPEWLIWHGQKCTGDKCYLEASLSVDRGDSWETLKRYVDRCEFTGSNAYQFRNKRQILCSARARENNDVDGNPLQLVYMDEFSKHEFTVALEHITRFATMAEFIVVATENKTEGTLSALASLDGKTYAHAHFPLNFQVSHQNAYTVLDSSTHAINLFVATEIEKSRRYGSILKSNSNGTSYVMSISGVNADDGWYVDFEKMLGLEGVMLVNTVANQDSDSEPKNLQTRISHNDGAQWSFLAPPHKDVEDKSYTCSSREGDAFCALHLHGYTERVDRGKTYSSKSAIGLMFGIGNVGPILGNTKDADTFMTQDAGMSWREVKKGSWTWSFGDQGSIVVLAQRNTKTRSISYSLNRGESWQDKEFSDSDVTITDITTLRSGSSRNFILWGHTGKNLIAVNLDFSGLTDKPCVHNEKDPDKSDYELWSPEHPLQPNGCLFGHKNWYLRKKKDRTCYNDQKLQEVHNFETCECTRQDYECDYNYELDAHNYCALVDGLRPKDPEQICRDDPKAIEYPEHTGLRRIPLTTCKGGTFDPNNVFKYHPCPGHEEEFQKKRGVSGIAILFAVVVPIAFAALVGWWVYKNWEGKFGQIRLGEQSSLDNDSPWIKYPVIAVSATVAIIGALPLLASSVWRTVRSTFTRLSGREDGGGRYSWLRSGGPRRFTTRDSFARGRGDYAIVDDDEGELLGDDSDDE